MIKNSFIEISCVKSNAFCLQNTSGGHSSYSSMFGQQSEPCPELDLPQDACQLGGGGVKALHRRGGGLPKSFHELNQISAKFPFHCRPQAVSPATLKGLPHDFRILGGLQQEDKRAETSANLCLPSWKHIWISRGGGGGRVLSCPAFHFIGNQQAPLLSSQPSIK